MVRRLVLPLPPTTNHSHFMTTEEKLDVSSGVVQIRNRPIRRRTQKTRDWMDDAATLAIDWKNRNRWRAPKEEKVICRLWYFWPDGRRRDTHNIPKVLLDALTGILWSDDRWVLVQEQDWQIDRRDPRVELEVFRQTGG